jgi:methionyl-tRNA synthetase
MISVRCPKCATRHRAGLDCPGCGKPKSPTRKAKRKAAKKRRKSVAAVTAAKDARAAERVANWRNP